jgi:hypothetical protein
MIRSHAYDMLRRVRDELDAGQFALGWIAADWDRNPILQVAAKSSEVTDHALRRCGENLQITFLLRLFSEFEAILRDYWSSGLHRGTNPDMQPLMESIARRRGMSDDDLAAAHAIRHYRNDVIHESLRDARFQFPECLRALGRYLRWLPMDW